MTPASDARETIAFAFEPAADLPFSRRKSMDNLQPRPKVRWRARLQRPEARPGRAGCDREAIELGHHAARFGV